MNRRKLLAGLGTAGVGSLSGCSTAKSIVRTGPPYFEEVSIDGPSEVEVGEEFSLKISAKNTGGRTGNFSATLTAGSGAFSSDTSVTVEEIPVAKTRSTEIGPTKFDAAGEYIFRITDHDASHELTVVPRKQEVGTQYESNNGVVASVEDAKVRGPYYSREGYARPPTGEAFLFLKVSAANNGDEKASLPTFTLFEGGSEVSRADVPHPQEMYSKYEVGYGTVSPGTDASGWIAFEVSRSASDLQLAWNIYGEGPDVLWQVSSKTTSKLRGVPSYSLESFSVPDSVEWYESIPATVAVSNDGEQSGTFYGTVTVHPDSFSEPPSERVQLEVPGGGSAETTVSLEPSETYATKESVDMELSGFLEDSETVQLEIPSRAVGETYTTPLGLEVGVMDAFFPDTVKTYDSWDGSYTDVVLGEGQKYLALKLRTWNGTDISLDMPYANSFSTENSSLLVPDVWGSNDKDLRGDVQGSIYFTQNSSPPGTAVEGWAIYAVPSGVSLDSLTVSWSRGLIAAKEEKTPLRATWDL